MNVGNFIFLSDLELTTFLFAIMLLLVSAHSFAYVFHLLGLPKVIGEISGGIILGPSILGFFQPDIYKLVFNAFESEGKLISSIYYFGLVLLMFITGFETQRSFNKEDKKITGVLVSATIFPFLAGWIAPQYYDFSFFLGEKQNIIALKIIIAISTAVTSIPVISRIFIDLNIMDTRFAKIVLTTATIHDLILWVALAIATGLVNHGGVSTTNIIYTVLITLVFFITMLLIMPRLVNFLTNNRFNFLLKSSLDGYTLCICLLLVIIAIILHVNIAFGAFLAGIILGPLSNDTFKVVQRNIKRFSLAFFIPIYFSVIGLKLDLIHSFDLSFCVLFLLFSSLFQIGGSFVAVKLIKLDNLSSFNFAVAMNTRGGPGIVIATIAYDIGIINETLFVTLVIIAIITSIFAGYWFQILLSKGYHLLK
ncbi:cation:proton antiporter [Pelosinus fermentans]|uniref:Sodium/hydrogen exchanger n=1 Tax=Pelosinus fermentans B4 TaxID=1149862 RepID=I8RFY3_9FIRM|nr:cation:proton antiporter [Pelosinus fermentans]EIW16645.1 sodium/hydrogen exchanger [Pelosinus fermentans B4]EIW22866.1 sodium/hydrogen exchanger [Pelosinus fermentans A11]